MKDFYIFIGENEHIVGIISAVDEMFAYLLAAYRYGLAVHLVPVIGHHQACAYPN